LKSIETHARAFLTLQFFGYLRTLSTPETVAFTPPWYQTWWNP
jgi:hypothetical protein